MSDMFGGLRKPEVPTHVTPKNVLLAETYVDLIFKESDYNDTLRKALEPMALQHGEAVAELFYPYMAKELSFEKLRREYIAIYSTTVAPEHLQYFINLQSDPNYVEASKGMTQASFGIGRSVGDMIGNLLTNLLTDEDFIRELEKHMPS